MDSPGFSRTMQSLQKNFLNKSEIVFASGLVAILTILIMPLPKVLLDASLAFSLIFSLVILMTALFIKNILDFNSFPTVLLVSTMMRLSLNVASTRLILSNGHEGTHSAGKIISAFGHFFMGGNFMIGMIIFAILIIINFVVITKGSGRIAEVSARFSLDALPGKQMSVDADLTAGLIDQEEAKKKRQIIQEETNFYGAMDGAAKFVRGDAIASLLITFINILGGIVVGVMQKNLTLIQALKTYTVLTVGDGLVTQIPALVVSIAAGMLVSKTTSEGSTDKAFFHQLSAYPIALGIGSVLSGAFVLVPGMPTLPFAFLCFVTGAAAWKATDVPAEKSTDLSQDKSNQRDMFSEASLKSSLKLENISLELGYGLLSLTLNDHLVNHIQSLRLNLAKEMGFVIPSVRVTDNLSLSPQEYRIRIKEVEVSTGQAYADKILMMNTKKPKPFPDSLPGHDVKEPIMGLPSRWISLDHRVNAQQDGFTTVDATTMVATHLSAAIKESLADLLSFADVQQLIDDLEKAYQKLFNDIVPTHLSPASFQRVLQNLLKEKVSIRNLSLILESISEACQLPHIGKSPLAFSEYTRSCLSRQLCAFYQNKKGVLSIVSLSPYWEGVFQEALSGPEGNKTLILSPTRTHEFMNKTKGVLEKITTSDTPVILTTAPLRPYVRLTVERFAPHVPVFSQNEIHPKVSLQNLGEI